MMGEGVVCVVIVRHDSFERLATTANRRGNEAVELRVGFEIHVHDHPFDPIRVALLEGAEAHGCSKHLAVPRNNVATALKKLSCDQQNKKLSYEPTKE